MKQIIGICLIISTAIAYADIIHLKNGLKIEGEITSVTSDSVAIKTSSGVINIADADIDRIETSAPETKAVREESIPKSIKQVGYGCLGGVIGAAGATMVAVWAEGFGDEKLTATLICGSVIIGIIAGAAVGLGK